MKNLKYTAYIILACLGYALMPGCDQIDPPYLEKKDVDTTTNKYVRKILLEEYTGFKCPNCPSAHDKSEELKQAYGDRLVVMAVHAGSYARTDAQHTYDFRTPAGNELNTFFGLNEYPTGMISRRSVNGSRLLSESGFEPPIIAMLQDVPKVILKLEPSFNGSTKEITVNVNAKYLSASSPNDNLCVFIVEDSVVQFQKDERKTPSDIWDYVHNNVLRESLTGTWGEQLSASAIKENDSFDKTYKYTIPSTKDWRPAKLRIIAFIHDNQGTYEIWQAEEAHLVK